MAGYLHTCGKCGAQMMVNERYVGRTLKCTTCRTEFVAEVSEGAVAAPNTVPRPERTESGSGARKLLPIGVLVIPLIGFAIWMSLGEDAPDAGFAEGFAVGEVATLGTGTTRPVLAARDQASVGALVDMRTGAVQVGVANLINNQDRYLELEAGTKVRVLAYANQDREAKVRIIDGPSADTEVWVPQRWLR